MTTNERFEFTAIATVESPYKEKFAIPRQPNLVNAAKGKIVLLGDANNHDLVRDIEQFSHLWLLFIFNATQAQGWKPLVRPPRLGGNKKTGVLATRSTFRPNPIGMSVVKLDSVEQTQIKGKQQCILHISGLDLLQDTPIIDIKPYLPYSDAISHANGGFAQTKPEVQLTVSFSEQAQVDLTQYQQKHSELALLIKQVLAQDPRPAYKKNKNDDKIYGMRLHDLNITWQVSSLTEITVINISDNIDNHVDK
jgi:tRNA-Thr(GGU) m(6)t(6)A37 methyltransferase TsaA